MIEEKLEKFKTTDERLLIKHALKRAKPIIGTSADKHLGNYQLSWGKNFKDASGMNGLWFVSELEYMKTRRKNECFTWNALITIARNCNGDLSSLYCRYLDEDSKLAPLDHPILQLSNNNSDKDRFIRLSDNTQGNMVCVLTIGLINGLSVLRLLKDDTVPVWAAVDRFALMAFTAPKWCKSVYIFISHDYYLTQLSAAINLKRRLLDEQIAHGLIPIYMPDEAITSYNDVLVNDLQFNLNRNLI